MEPWDLAATTWSVIPAFDVPPNAPATLTRSGGWPSLYHQWSLPPWPAELAGLRCTTDCPAAPTHSGARPSLYHLLSPRERLGGFLKHATLTRSGGQPSLYHPLSFTILVYFMEAQAPF